MDARAVDEHAARAAISPDQPVPPGPPRPAAPRAVPAPARPGWRDLPPAQAGALGIAALAVAGATAVGWRWAGRPARIGPITMGPGGWVSVKGARPPADPGARPWWARLLRAYRF